MINQILSNIKESIFFTQLLKFNIGAPFRADFNRGAPRNNISEISLQNCRAIFEHTEGRPGSKGRQHTRHPLLESSGGLFMDTSTLLHVYVDVDILFNSHIHDAGFYFDAARVVLAAEASGIPPENIRLYSKVRSISPTSYFFC